MKKKTTEPFLDWFIRDCRVNFEVRWENSFKDHQLPNHPAFKRGGELFDHAIAPYIREAYEAGLDGSKPLRKTASKRKPKPRA